MNNLREVSMATFNNKKFNSATGNLEKMADGAKIHYAEEGYPALVTEEGLRADKLALENSREEYEEVENNARIKFDEYEALYTQIETRYKKFATQLYGFYGKKNQVVADFGLKPHKTTGKRGPRGGQG
jgi:hypothetical protein